MLIYISARSESAYSYQSALQHGHSCLPPAHAVCPPQRHSLSSQSPESASMAHPVRGFFSPIIPSSMTSSVFSTQRRSHGSSFRTSFPSFLCHFFCTNLHFFKLQYTLARTEMQRKSAFSPLFLHIPLCRIQMQKKRIFFFIFLYAWIPLFSSPDSFTPNS